ncbi:type II toxin-antitoxin system RelE/ParE family toxin [Methylobacterium oxalidis]|uniref:type II toxin-antitoxin system RelE/ParE family toxin n=1 Tax=Methylobacterium oxalidis TaxID=944322 RepID=UPI003315B10E
MMIYVPRDFAKRAAREHIADPVLREAVDRAERGIVDARIGADLIKQRIARDGAGRSGGFRTIIAYRKGDRAVFLHLFAKSAKANLSAAEADAFRAVAKVLAGLDEAALGRLAAERGWRRIDDERT